MATMTDDSVFQRVGQSKVHSLMNECLREPYRQPPELTSNGFDYSEGGDGRHREVATDHRNNNGFYTNGKHLNGNYGNASLISEPQTHMIGIHTKGTYTNGFHYTNGTRLDRNNNYGLHTNGISTNGMSTNGTASNIIDIRNDHSQLNLTQMVRESLRSASPSLPSLVLWDDRGLKLFEQVTQLPDYYISRVEKDILEQHCKEVAREIEPGSMIVDLGCGSTDKIMPILQALDSLSRSIDYYALDLCPAEVRRSLDSMSPHRFKHVRCHGLIGTFDDARSWLQLSENVDTPKCLVSLGSSIGNLTDTEAAKFLSGFAQTLRHRTGSVMELQSATARPMSTMLVGLDSCKSEDTVRAAYDDGTGLNASFLLNALEHVNTLLGYEVFRTKEWIVHGEWIKGCYKQYLVPLVDVAFEDTNFDAGTKIYMVQSQKYGPQEKARLWEVANLRQLQGWRSRDAAYGDDPMISMLALDIGDA